MPMRLSFTAFVIAAFAVWRVAHLIACEDGPGDILVRLRQRLGSGFAGSLMDCFNCVTIWISVPALFIAASWAERIIIWLGISGAACLLERVSERKESGGNKDALLWREESGAETADEHAAKH
jgi:hypothetical protein